MNGLIFPAGCVTLLAILLTVIGVRHALADNAEAALAGAGAFVIVGHPGRILDGPRSGGEPLWIM